MTYEFEYLLHLLSASTFGCNVEPPNQPIDWEKLFRLAKEQTIFPNVVYALKHFSQPVIDPVKYRNVLSEYRSIIVAESIRRDAIYELLDYLRKAGIPLAVLKGISLSALYEVPECRVSGDLDIYVGVENEHKAMEVLRQYGVSVQERDPQCQEAKCTHPQIGLIELHAYLFCEEDRKFWFAREKEFTGITAAFTSIMDNTGYAIPVLADQDNALFLSLHLIKHFIKEGISLRNIADIALYIQKRSMLFNMEEVWAALKKLKLDKIIHVVLSSCVYYMSMDQDAFPGLELMDKKLVDEFLTDLERGGNLGFKEKKDRAESKKIYDKHVFEELGYNSVRYAWKKRNLFLGMLRALFDCKDRLMRYPYARKNKILIPIAWFQYVGEGMRKIIQGKIRPIRMSTRAPISDVGQMRIELFKKLGLM